MTVPEEEAVMMVLERVPVAASNAGAELALKKVSHGAGKAVPKQVTSGQCSSAQGLTWVVALQMAVVLHHLRDRTKGPNIRAEGPLHPEL